MAKRKLVIPAIMRRFGGHTYYEYISNVAKKTAESEARKAKGAGLLTRVVPTGSKWTVYTRAPENPSKKRRVAEAGIGSAPVVLGILFFVGLIYLGKKSASE